MKRRIEDTGGRPEATAAGIVSGGQLGGVGGAGGYVRVPPTVPTIAVGTSIAGGVATVPAPSIGNSIVHTTVHTTHEHPHSGYPSGKVEMHTGVHHTIPSYATNLSSGTPQGVMGGVETGRPVVGTPMPGNIMSGSPSQAVAPGPPASHSPHPVLQHGNNPTAAVRQRTGSNNVIHTPASIGAGAATIAACAAAAGNNQVAGQFQRLKVEDALSYLDQVKLRFGRQPQVYNDFLDIMKEFKSQSIDTPGVIARVSQLFRGHPELIVGFNTFLPPGYKIEVSVVTGQQTTVVHTPQGIHHHVTPTPPSQGALSPSVTVKATPSPHAIHPPNAQRPSSLPPVNQHPGPCAPSGTPSPLMPNSVIGLSTSPSLTVNANSAQGLGPTVAPVGVPQVGVNMSTGAPQPSSSLPNCLMGTNSSVGGANSLGGGSGNTQLPPQNREPTPQPPTPTVPSIHHLHQHQPAAQPVEFNHAINYVNKIKLRFQGQPDIYKQFLEILHTYQKEQKHIKEGGVMPTRTLTEAEVYEKVAKLFENQEDLLQEFGQFLPDATNNTATQAAVSNFMDQCRSHNTLQATKPLANDHAVKKPSLKASCNVQANNNIHPSSTGPPVPAPTLGVPPPPPPNNANVSIYGSHGLKRPYSSSGAQIVSAGGQHPPPHPPVKKPKLSYLKDMSAAEAGKFATLAEYAFFDRVRKALRHEETYFNFLRCITLFNEDIISRSELVQVIHPFLAKFPELLKWFKDFTGLCDGTSAPPTDIIPASVAKQERISGDLAMEIDYTTCKRLGASYCALPKTYPQPQCSGRNKNNLCKEVLNDTWVSFPSWSEDSTFVTSRKTQYEEYIYRCEDERFELDVVLETNLATIRVLEWVQKKLQRMSPEEAARFRLDDSIGGSSPTICQRAIKRIYGEKASDIIDGLKKNPVIAVPLVLRRLKAKDEEWREAQKGFNKVWREQNERYYLKSLDHQGITFKQNDIKTLRSKSLLNEIETLYDERHEQAEDGGELVVGPHMVLPYKDKTPLDDAANLIIHHVRRQTTIHKEDKAKIKQLVKHFIPDLFFHPRMELSDDENVEEEMDEDCNSKSESKASSLKKESAIPPNALAASPPSSSPGGSAPASSSEGFSSPTAAAPTNGAKRKTRSNKYPAEPDKDSKEHEIVTSSATCTSSSSLPGTITTATGTCASSTTVSDSVASTMKSGDRVTVNGDASDSSGGVVKTETESDPETPHVKSEPQEEGTKQNPFSVASSSLADDEYRLFLGNNNWFIFLRLHYILCQRLSTMYEHAVRIAAEEVKEKRDRRESTAVALRLKPKNDIAVEDYYPALLDMVQNMLDGNLETNAFEDTLRDMFGISAYTAFTLDKVVNGAVRQLQHIVCDEVPSQCTTQYLQEGRRGGAGGPIASIHRRMNLEQRYQRKIEKLLQDENCFKVFTYKRDSRLTVELIDTDLDESEEQQNASATTPPNAITSVSAANTSSLPATNTTASTTTVSHSNNNNNNTISSTTASTNGEPPDSGGKNDFVTGDKSPLFVHPLIPPAVVEVERWSEYVEKYVTTVSPQVSPAMQAQLCRKPVFLPRNLRAWKREISGRNSQKHSKNVVKSEAHGMEIMDNTQCKFNLSNKMVFVANSDSYVYKREALRRAKESHEAVSKRKKRGFNNWHKTWSDKHVIDTEAERTDNWFMGQIEGLRPNKTRRKRVERLRQPPYLPFNKYECDIIQENSSS